MTTSIKKIRIENTKEFKGEIIKVFKSDFEIYKHELSSEPYYSISLKEGHGGNNVWGGDSANEDDYSYSYAETSFNEWDGTLYYSDRYGYTINP